ncbi:MAG: cell division protein FtsZ [Patescibacteria group bacterium]
MLVKPHSGNGQVAKIKVVGVGGGGSNAIGSMIDEGGIAGVEFISVNTDAQALLFNKANIKVQIGDDVTRGLGSGGNPDVGSKAAEESVEKLREELTGADLVFITAGMGGGTGTGASPVVARIARECGALTVAVVTKPFLFEGSKRMNAAKSGIASLKEHVDTLIIVPNQRILQIIDNKTSMIEALKKIDSVLHQGVRGIAELITEPGLINVDFADVKTIMSNSGSALMGIGVATGDSRAIRAVQEAITSPLLDSTIEGARGVLINITGGPDLTMLEVDEAANMVSQAVDPEADIIFGATIKEDLRDNVKVTLIATKFDERINLVRSRTDQMSSFSRNAPQNPISLQNETKSNVSPANIPDPIRTTRVTQNIPSEKPEYELDNDEFDVPAFLRKK